MIAAFSVCTIFGVIKSSKLKNRSEGILELLEGVRRINVLMQYSARPLQQIIFQLNVQRSSVIWKELSGQLNMNCTFQTAWNTAIMAARREDPRFAALKEVELTAMEELSRELGRSDLASQQKHLGLTESLLEEYYLAAAKAAAQRERIYRALGIAAGLASAIIIW